MSSTPPLAPDHTQEHGLESPMFDAASRALFQLGRAFARLPRPDLLAPTSRHGPDLGAILLTQTVLDAETTDQTVTIGDIATHLAIDPSTASRLVARAVHNGHLRRAPAPDDARVASLHLTSSGHTLATDAARYQRAVFDSATESWSATDRQTFARLFVDFAATITTFTTTQTITDAQEIP